MYSERENLDEMINELYTVKMLETEGIYNTNILTIKFRTLVDPVLETVEYHGNGYIRMAQLAKLYDRLFGNELLKAKLFNKEEFKDRFNRKYKDISIPVKEHRDQDSPNFAKLGIQIGEDLYGAYGTAIDIWKTKKL